MSVAMAPLMATFSPAVAAVALPVPVEKPVSLVFPKFFSMFGKVMNSFVVPTPAPGSRHVTCRFHHGIKPTPCVMHRTSGRMKLQATCLLNGAPPMLHDSPRNSVTRSSRDLDDAPSAAVMESPNAATTWQGPHIYQDRANPRGSLDRAEGAESSNAGLPYRDVTWSELVDAGRRRRGRQAFARERS